MKVVRWFIDLLYRADSVCFASRFSRAESVRRLSAASESSFLAAMTKQCAFGTVSTERVRLQRWIPFVGNSWKPIFFGRFEEVDGGTVLVGRFTMSPGVKVFMSIWFGFIGATVVLGILVALGSSLTEWVFLACSVALFSLGAAGVRLGKWLARNDAAWLTAVIEQALESRAARPLA